MPSFQLQCCGDCKPNKILKFILKYEDTCLFFFQATISHVLKAAIICKGVLIEWVTVKGYDEPMEIEDLWTESRYEVFRKVQEHTHSAMLHFFSPTLPELAVKSYMVKL